MMLVWSGDFGKGRKVGQLLYTFSLQNNVIIHEMKIQDNDEILYFFTENVCEQC